MNFFSGLANGLREIWAHKFRSFLSMIGIIMGVAALVVMVGIVEGMFLGFRDFFERNGGIRRIQISEESPPLEQEPIAHRSPGLSMNDVYAIKHSVPTVSLLSPQLDVGWERIYGPEGRRSAYITGVTKDYLELETYEIKKGGRFISASDIDNFSSVVVLPERVVNSIWKRNVDPIGKQVDIHGSRFTVIGVIKKNKDWWSERRCLIPITTAEFRLNSDRELDRLSLLIHDGNDLNASVSMIRNVLLQTHNGIEDFAIQTQAEQLKEYSRLEQGFTVSLGGIAAVTLLVGGVGILNVMLAVINERIREIGVRKAVGARGVDIFVQFLAEALVISTLGGLLGIFASVGMVELLKEVMPEEIKIILSAKAMIVGFAFSVILGLLSGIYPALKAANLNVIDALRYE